MENHIVNVLIHYDLSEAHVTALREISERLHISHYPGGSFKDIPQEARQAAEVLLTSRSLPEAEQVPNLRWIQFAYAGIDQVSGSELFEREGFQITSGSGAVAPKAAEYALMAMLALGHKLPGMLPYQQQKQWPPDRWERFPAVELRGSTVGLLGYGSIGREIARLLQPLEVNILATKRDLKQLADEGYTPPGTGDTQGVLFNRLYPPEALHSMLGKCDFVVVCLPLTPDTHMVMNAAALQAMKPGAYLVALGRGGQVDESALAQALHEGHLGGAVLDVFEHEPLPPESPLWEAPNLLITPHIAGNSPRFQERVFDLFSNNLRHYLRGEPLLNVFERERGY